MCHEGGCVCIFMRVCHVGVCVYDEGDMMGSSTRFMPCGSYL